jgi:Cu2+-exporting ATPase
VDLLLRAPDLATSWQALRLEQALQALPGTHRIDIDTTARRIRLGLDLRVTGIARILDACAACNCPAQPLPREALDDPRRRQADDALKHMLVAGIFAMQTMMFALVLYLGRGQGVDTSTAQLFRWLCMLSATPVVGYAAMPFFRDAWADLKAGRPGVDLPVALAIALVFAASVFNTFRGRGEIWFDSVSMLAFVLLLGRWLEGRTRERNDALGEAASASRPLLARRRNSDGALETVAVSELAPGDAIHVAEGLMVPVDAVVAQPCARLDTSMHTGESRPVTARRGERVSAGSVVLDAPVHLQVMRAGAESRLALMAHLARRARAARPRTGRYEGAGVMRFIAAVLGVAALTLALWLWRDPSRAFAATVAVLVVACPCAFALAGPATLTRAMARLARRGVLVTRAFALPALARADRALLDKTGTLTTPALDPATIDTFDTFGGIEREQALCLAGALARESSHPASRAVSAQAENLDLPAVRDVTVVAGGVSGCVDGRALRLGRATYACPGQTDDDALWLADTDGPLARLPLHETLRAGSAALLDAFREGGIAASVVSGDAAGSVARVAGQLGLARWHARQSPEDKLRRVQTWQRDGHRVLAIGDGGNDAGALAAADVSASLAGATDLARGEADILLEDGLQGLILAQRMAVQADHVLAQNRRWALAYNAVAIPFAMAGLVSPWLAALGMSLSSLAVVMNTLRLGATAHAPAASSVPHGLKERTA